MIEYKLVKLQKSRIASGQRINMQGEEKTERNGAKLNAFLMSTTKYSSK